MEKNVDIITLYIKAVQVSHNIWVLKCPNIKNINISFISWTHPHRHFRILYFTCIRRSGFCGRCGSSPLVNISQQVTPYDHTSLLWENFPCSIHSNAYLDRKYQEKLLQRETIWHHFETTVLYILLLLSLLLL